MFGALGFIVRVAIALFVVFVVILAFSAVVDFIAAKNREIVKASFIAAAPVYMSSSPTGPPELQFHAGQRVYIHVDQERKLACTINRSMRIISFLDDDPFHRVIWENYPDSHGVKTSGHYILEISMMLPGDLPKGKYDVDIISTYDCDTMHYQTAMPPVPFEVG